MLQKVKNYSKNIYNAIFKKHRSSFAFGILLSSITILFSITATVLLTVEMLEIVPITKNFVLFKDTMFNIMILSSCCSGCYLFGCKVTLEECSHTMDEIFADLKQEILAMMVKNNPEAFRNYLNEKYNK